MRYLLYCVFGRGRDPEGASRPPLSPAEAAENRPYADKTMEGAGVGIKRAQAASQQHPPGPVSPAVGVDGKPVRVITCGKMGAAYSHISRFDPLPDTSQLLTYHRVIEQFHRRCTVIPISYGTLFDGEQQIGEHLEQRRRCYTRLLGELEGRAEMGIRVLIPGFAAAAGRTTPPPDFPPVSGRAYLGARGAHYARRERLDGECRDIVRRCRSAFAGLYTRCRTVSPRRFRPPLGPDAPLLSLFFLIPRDSLEPFRQAFSRFSAGESSRLLLTGPWPPYNFVCREESSRL